MVMGAVSDARAEGNPIGIAASQKAYGIAAALQAPGAPVPAIVDNELGGIAFFWKGVSREIQIEIDADNSYFVRIKQGNTVKFTEEGFGNVPIDPVNTALREWAAERRASLAVTA
ncbi:hypothetical protein [Microbacterium sp. 16-032]|uniref:hypothetical protein n=1 Tax=Microbacterium sp. 16-032 TaxID=3239808 RepID=UPI0034E21C86